MQLTQVDIDNSLSTIYGLGNDILYSMCKNNFEHTSIDAVLAKTIIIGRTYAVALDRGKDKGKSDDEKLKLLLINGDFYQNKVVPLFMASDIDVKLARLKNLDSPEGVEADILVLHNDLKEILLPINKEDKISFCSKYLHFHLPNLFFIYDSRAKSVINDFVVKKDVQYFKASNFDTKYAKFYSKARHLQKSIADDFELLTPRQIDNLFLIPANEKLRKRIIEKIEKNKNKQKPIGKTSLAIASV